MKAIPQTNEPVNILTGKDRLRNLYIVNFDARQIVPRVTLGSTWIAFDKRHSRRFLLRVVDMGYPDEYDPKNILPSLRENPNAKFDEGDYQYYCSEKAWMRLEGEITNLGLVEVGDQPTVLQTFLCPTTFRDDLIIASTDTTRGFAIGNLRSGNKKLQPLVTLKDRFVGHRTLVSGTSGFGKSTLVRNLIRYWLENREYGKLIDDLKCEYIDDIKDESKNLVPGLKHHPNAKEHLFLLTTNPGRFRGTRVEDCIAGIIPLRFSLDDIPPASLKGVVTHLSDPQRAFLDMYQDKPQLFEILMKTTEDGSPDIIAWANAFGGWISIVKTAKDKIKRDDYALDPSDIAQNTLSPIHAIVRQLKRLTFRPYLKKESGSSCLTKVAELLKRGATIIIDKSTLTDSDRIIISSIIADNLYRNNEQASSGTIDNQKGIIPFVYVVEEAHNLLSTEMVREESVFVDFAKTGRSFGIGLFAITQQPSSIDPKITSQFDNYITLRLMGERDVKDLVNATSAFEGFESEIRSLERGAALAMVDEAMKVQSVQVFEWNENRAHSLLSKEQTLLEKALLEKLNTNNND